MGNSSTTEPSPRAPKMATPEIKAMPLNSLPIREVSAAPPSAIRYSICTLVTNLDEYAGMVTSFIQAGFDPAFCEFLYLDNSQANRFDAFRGYNIFFDRAQGEYLILCHQDILLFDDRREKLEACMRELTERDPHWALFGNAGGINLGNRACRITDPDGPHKVGTFPVEVNTLDENFIVVRRSANLALSQDLAGFHFYGTDLCLVAKLRGCRAYVVDFNLFHKSRGNCDQHFKALKRALVKKYCAAYKGRYVETTCTRFYISGYRFQSLFFQLGIVRSIIKRWNRLKRKWANLLGKGGNSTVPRAEPLQFQKTPEAGGSEIRNP